MEEELYTIQLTRRELGLIKHYSRLLFANIDDDVSNAELSMRLYDQELESNIEYDS